MDQSQGDLRSTAPQDLISPIEFAKENGLQFKQPWLLQRAFTHRSYLNENPGALEDNERLEFLGDAVLDFMVGAWLYHHFPEMAEGQLTRLRAALVGNNQLAEFARQLNFGAVLLLGKGESDGGGRSRSALLGSTFEAVVGALFLDQDIASVQKFLEPFLEKASFKIIEDNLDRDAKSRLQEWSQSCGLGAPSYRKVTESGPDHEKLFEVEVVIAGEVYGRGQGHSKQAATKAAARNALAALGQDQV